MQVKSIAECSNGAHSAILSIFIKLLLVNKVFVMSFLEWPLKTGFTVFYNLMSKDKHVQRKNIQKER